MSRDTVRLNEYPAHYLLKLLLRRSFSISTKCMNAADVPMAPAPNVSSLNWSISSSSSTRPPSSSSRVQSSSKDWRWTEKNRTWWSQSEQITHSLLQTRLGSISYKALEQHVYGKWEQDCPHVHYKRAVKIKKSSKEACNTNVGQVTDDCHSLHSVCE